MASFFVSRVDTEVDKRLDAIGTDEAKALQGQGRDRQRAAGLRAPTRRSFASERFAALEADGANPQRPLWASTGVKDPAYADTMYVTDLVVDGRVNTMPEKTMQAFADHGEVTGDTVSGRVDEAQAVFAAARRSRRRLRRRPRGARERGRRQVREVLGRARRHRDRPARRGLDVTAWNTVKGDDHELFFGYRDEQAFVDAVEDLVADKVASRLAAQDPHPVGSGSRGGVRQAPGVGLARDLVAAPRRRDPRALAPTCRDSS